MKDSIVATVEAEDGRTARMMPIGTIERSATADPASGMGLWIGEAHELVEKLISIILDEHVQQFVKAAARCLACHEPLGIKDNKTIVYRTAYGKKALRSPRFYSTCVGCGYRSGEGATVSPLEKALKQRTHPQWSWLQCRYAGTMS